jgi:hypothetical protein
MGMHPHPHQPGLIFPSENVRQKSGHCHSVCTVTSIKTDISTVEACKGKKRKAEAK